MTFKSLAALVAVVLLPIAAAHAQRTDNPHGRGIGPCAACHAPDSWRPVRISKDFRHAEQTFPLEGAHVRTACIACHKNLVFDKVTNTCASCHTDVHQGELGTDCARCHTPRSFVDQGQLRRMHELTRLPLRGAHAAARCDACHTPAVSGQAQYLGRPTACFACHAPDYRQAKSPDHVVAQFSQDCASCHGNSSWRDARFDHSATRFALAGAHKAVSCNSCHADKVYRGKSMECVSCHQGDYDRSANPPHSPGFPTTCTTCHSVVSWKDTKFDHNTTRFALTGSHRTTTCVACHADRVYRGKSMECVSCHQKDYAASVIPPHASLAFPTVCATCHTTAAWPGASYDHSVTKFALTGAHRTVTCTTCHADKVYHGKPMACASCHQAKFAATVNPPHAAAAFPNTCETCHTTTAWTPGTFNHSNTRFPLQGAHATALCSACHADGVYRGKPITCISCHQKVYDATVIPPHASLGFSTVCSTCHTSTTTWQGGAFDHATTRFPLTGGHRTVSCNGCHADKVFRGKSTVCSSCHQAKYAATSQPPHGAAGFPNTCETCHTTTAWTPATFSHAATRFPLQGVHATTPCMSCHADGVYRGKPITCISCHQQNYNAALIPPHSSLGYSTVCTDCHSSMTTWKGAVFNHQLFPFPLTGAHLTVSCNGCHADNVYKGKSTACASCHQTRYAATTNPPHAAAGFPITCETCHTTASWLTATFNHATTRFPLTGGHLTVVCSGCHADGVYRGKTMVCSGCHLAKYTATRSPAHAAAGFPVTCETCHTTTAWMPSTFSHATTRFPLTGAHVTVPCTSCHGDGVYRGKTMVCSGCHLTKYNATTNPVHSAAGFATACESCHTTATWLGAKYTAHDASFFPIYSGKHNGRWSVCADCHTSSTNFAIFSCFQCHLKPQMDSKHQGRSGYSYDSARCYACHPRGSAG
jgi:hypothetical protein